MAGAAKLDNAGTIKLKVLDEALGHVQGLHSLVERMGMAVKQKQPTSLFAMQFKRAATPLVGMLKGQFGILADQVSHLILISTRGGSEQTKLRSMREGVAQLRTAMEITQNRVKEQHKVVEDADAKDADAKDAATGAPPTGAPKGTPNT
jgi:hypothetical protein